MTLNIQEPVKYYFHNGFYWKVTESALVQFTEDFFNAWKPGTELFYYKRRELSVTKPLNDKQGQYVWDLLKKRIGELEMETVK